MARNRKRRSGARERRPGPDRPGVATARGNRPGDVPDPIEHGTPDVELAEAHLALGRPEYTEAEIAASAGAGDEPAEDQSADDESAEARPGEEEAGGDGGGGGYDEDDDDLGPDDDGSGGGRHVTSTAVSAPRERSGSRLVHFLQGSWRELQRVQWPDRRQVMQATGVVIGFVIVAGAFLGVADFVATKVVKLILP
jgi:preprotein translocase subunit SecE